MMGVSNIKCDLPADEIGIYGTKVFECFRKTKVPGEVWPHTTYCVFECTLSDKEMLVIMRNKEVHVEHIVKEFLQNNRITSPIIKLYMNYSPCSKCSNTILDFVEENGQIRLEIVSSGLYYIPESQANIDGLKKPSGLYNIPEKSQANIDGLKKLQQRKSVRFRSFVKSDWIDLERLLRNYIGLHPFSVSSQDEPGISDAFKQLSMK